MTNKIYSAQACHFCRKAKELFQDEGIPFEEISLEDEELRAEFLKKYPDQKTVPLIILDNKVIGGYEDLRRYLKL